VEREQQEQIVKITSGSYAGCYISLEDVKAALKKHSDLTDHEIDEWDQVVDMVKFCDSYMRVLMAGDYYWEIIGQLAEEMFQDFNRKY
jgi:hypothetical protein